MVDAPVLDQAAVREWLETYRGRWAGANGDLVITAFKGGSSLGSRAFSCTSEIDAAATFVVKLDGQEPSGIYVRGTTVKPGSVRTGRGYKTDTMIWLRFQVDGDYGKPGAPPDAATVRELVEKAPVPDPTDWIDSGHGLYPSWDLEPAVPDSENVRALALDIESAIRATFADAGYTLDSCYDAARVWRIPGTVNRKDPTQPVPCRVIERSGRVYRFGDLRAAVPTGATSAGGNGDLNGMRPATATATKDFLTALSDGPACRAVRRVRDAAVLDLAGTDRHASTLRHVKRLVRMGEQGHHGVPAVLDELNPAFVAAVSDREDGGDGADGEFARMLSGAVAKIAAIPTRDEDKRCCGPAEPAIMPPNEATGAPDGQETAGETVRDSWVPVDLGPYLRGEVVPAVPSVGVARTDGVQFLYPGKEHACIGETESGKSWFALACVAAVLLAGGRVVYIHFEEADPADTLARLQLLGVPVSRIIAGVAFVGPETPVTPHSIARLIEVPPQLVVLDGVNEAMALHAQKINDPDGAAAYRTRLVKPFKAAGAAVLSLDHVVKDPDRNGQGYAFGSIHKTNGLDGAMFLIENREPFGKGRRGNSGVYVTKDRPGNLRTHGVPTKVARKFHLCEMVVDSASGFEFALFPPKNDEARAEEHDGQVAELDEQVFQVAARTIASDIEASTRAIRAQIPRRSAAVAEALDRLVIASRLSVRKVGAASIYSLPTVPMIENADD